MNFNYKHIIWDWNGTLLNDAELCVEIVNEILAKRNINYLTLEKYRDIFTFPIINYYINAGFDFTQYSFEEVGQEWMIEYEKRKTECLLQTGAKEILHSLKERNIGQSILSAYHKDTLLEIISHFNLNSYFKHITGLDNIYAAGKAEIGKKLMEKISNVNNINNVVLIGDTVHDYEVAKEIGADCILISDGHQSKEKLLQCKVPVFDSLIDFYSNFSS